MLGSLARVAMAGRTARWGANCLLVATHRQGAGPASRVHSAASDGFGGENASNYEVTRPGYPDVALRVMEAEIAKSQESSAVQGDGRKGDRHGRTLVDLGCGTGKFTREILPFAREHGLSVLGVEPVQAMRDQFSSVMPGVAVTEGTGERIPVADGSCVAVVAAQSFHWMSSAECVREIHRVLVPGGVLLLIWNTRDVSKPWVRALEDIIEPCYSSDVPQQQTGAWRVPFQDLQQEWLFGGISSRHYESSQHLTPDELSYRVKSISVIAQCPEPEVQEIMGRVRELVGTHPDTREMVKNSGKVELFYDTELHVCRKLVS